MADAKILGDGESQSSLLAGAHSVDADPAETKEWLDSLEYVIESRGPEHAAFILQQLRNRAKQQRIPQTNTHRPIPNSPCENAIRIPGHKAQLGHGRHLIAQPIGRQRLAPRCKTQVIEGLDLPPILRRLGREGVHGRGLSRMVKCGLGWKPP